MAETIKARTCPHCHCERVWPADQVAHCMSDEEWEVYIDRLTLPDAERDVDALERWLS